MSDDSPKTLAGSLEEYVRKVVEEAPPLTDEQRARLRALLTAR